MAAAKPVVAYDLPVFREIFPSGMCRIPIGDRKEFGRAISRLLSFPEDARALANQGLLVAAGLNWDNIATSELERLQYLVSNHGVTTQR